MTIQDRVDLYKSMFSECNALEPVSHIMAKGYKNKTPLGKLELLRELATELTEVYKVYIPTVTCWERDNNYVKGTKEIYLAEPDLEGFLHEWRHHLQNEARDPNKILLLVEDDPQKDRKILFKDTISTFYGEDDAVAWARMIMESI